MPGDSITQIKIGDGASGPNALTRPLPSGQPQLQIPDQAFKLYDTMVDPGAMYLNDLTREYFAAQLVYTGTVDAASPLPGYKLQRLELDNKKAHPNLNFSGYISFAGMWILSASRAISSTNWHDKHSVEEFALDETMGAIDQLTANADYWELADDELIYTSALAYWKNLTAIGRRSHKGGFFDVIKSMFAPQPVAPQPQKSWITPWIK